MLLADATFLNVYVAVVVVTPSVAVSTTLTVSPMFIPFPIVMVRSEVYVTAAALPILYVPEIA